MPSAPRLNSKDRRFCSKAFMTISLVQNILIAGRELREGNARTRRVPHPCAFSCARACPEPAEGVGFHEPQSLGGLTSFRSTTATGKGTILLVPQIVREDTARLRYASH